VHSAADLPPLLDGVSNALTMSVVDIARGFAGPLRYECNFQIQPLRVAGILLSLEISLVSYVFREIPAVKQETNTIVSHITSYKAPVAKVRLLSRIHD